MSVDELLWLWGKTPRPERPPAQYHPAIFHMLDVAFSAKQLFEHGPPRLRAALLHAWRGIDEDAFSAWLPLIIALHDIGKHSSPFQGQVEDQKSRLEALGVRFDRIHGTVQLPHATVSAGWVCTSLQRHAGPIPRKFQIVIEDALSGHHGRFPQEALRGVEAKLNECERSEPRWGRWRDETFTILKDILLPIDAPPLAAIGAPEHLSAATIALTGFLVQADWIGSNEHDFPAEPRCTLPTYIELSQERAAQALKTHHFHQAWEIPPYTDYKTIFGKRPRHLQECVEQLPDEQLRRPALFVIEASTGEGKTEAAQVLGCRIAAQRGYADLFFALPTMATSNQMFQRLEEFVAKRYGAQVRLAHSQAIAFEEDLRRQVHLAADCDRFDPDGLSARDALAWFSGPKKALLAAFGVGTVDQIEVGGLNVRHYPLRLWGLAGKVVVIDEVHAYDTYMSTILAHTLTWLASLGTSVILLSATLPAARHAALASAYLQGLGDVTPVPAPEKPAEAPYPAVAVYATGIQDSQPCAAFRSQQLTLRVITRRTPEQEAQELWERVREGGAVARICNRVADAQEIAAALKELGICAEYVLLHARLPLDTRKKREARIIELVGPNSTRTPNEPIILIGTQVLEQSLDYDVDLMISDFAPIDLLLQRAGRLHRHDRKGFTRPADHQAPVLEVVLPLDEERRPYWRRWARIYETFILWQTWIALGRPLPGERRPIELPLQYRELIEAVYGNDTPLPAADLFASSINQARTHMQRERADNERKAQQVLTPPASARARITNYPDVRYIAEEDSAQESWQIAKTRLGDSITIVPLYDVAGQRCLDRGGTWPISKDVAPTYDIDRQIDILNHSIPISDPRIIRALRDDARPDEQKWPWKDVPALLRGIVPVTFDHQQTAQIAGQRLRIDQELGLVIEKEDL